MTYDVVIHEMTAYPTPFKNVDVGEFFRWGGDIFMKTDYDGKAMELSPQVWPTTGFEPDDVVDVLPVTDIDFFCLPKLEDEDEDW